MKVNSVINTTVMQLSHHIATTKLVIAKRITESATTRFMALTSVTKANFYTVLGTSYIA